MLKITFAQHELLFTKNILLQFLASVDPARKWVEISSMGMQIKNGSGCSWALMEIYFTITNKYKNKWEKLNQITIDIIPQSGITYCYIKANYYVLIMLKLLHISVLYCKWYIF